MRYYVLEGGFEIWLQEFQETYGYWVEYDTEGSATQVQPKIPAGISSRQCGLCQRWNLYLPHAHAPRLRYSSAVAAQN